MPGSHFKIDVKFLRSVRAMAIALLFLPSAFVGNSANADGSRVESPIPFVVSNDIGGLLANRMRALGQLRADQTTVEIRGNICYSTCTMYLGIPDVCVSRNTTFGFHGPSSFGTTLSPAVFENASRAIAAHYPEPLRNWYMSKGRYRVNSLYYVRGSELINMGVRSC